MRPMRKDLMWREHENIHIQVSRRELSAKTKLNLLNWEFDSSEASSTFSNISVTFW